MANPDDIKALIEVTGKYEVLSTFTEGANGYAFKARHRHLDRVIFLKVIDADPEAQKTFAEPKALMDAVSAGNCENLVSLYDAEHLTQEYILMATEFVDGGNLQAFIQDRSLGQMDTVKITLGVLAGLGHLHAARFLHRDVKPGNLLLNSTPAGRTPKVGDFGSVRRLEGEATRVQASRHSAVYRPPEAWGDDGWFTFASDLYQAGICLYEMVNGPLPYDFKDQLDAQAKREMKDLGITLGDLGAFERSKLVDGCLERRIRKGKLLEMTPSQPYVSGRLAKIIRKATAIDAADRYQNAFEFTNALQALSAPNWRTATDGFTADSWKKWDWKVIPTGSAPKIHWAVSRARSGTGKFRAFGKPFCSAQEAFKSVEDFN